MTRPQTGKPRWQKYFPPILGINLPVLFLLAVIFIGVRNGAVDNYPRWHVFVIGVYYSVSLTLLLMLGFLSQKFMHNKFRLGMCFLNFLGTLSLGLTSFFLIVMSPTLYSQVGLGRILPIVFQTILNSIIGLKFIIDCLELGLGNEKAPQNFEVYAPKIASASNKYESAFHVVLWVILLGYYVFFALSENQMGGNGYGGFYQFSNLVRIILPAVMISVIFILLNKRAQQTLKRLVFFVQQLVFQNLKTILVTSALFFVGFFIFRNEFINQDGISLAEKIPRAVANKGALVTHDEMLELYVHSRIWYYANTWFGWSLKFSYQLLSSMAGGGFVFLLLLYAKKFKHQGLPFFGLVISGGYMQLFFGDVENYTLTAFWIMAYFLSVQKFFEENGSVVFSAVLLAIAMIFHFQAGLLLPSFIYLLLYAYSRGHFEQIIWAIGLFVLVIMATFVLFNYSLLPFEALFTNSHIGKSFTRFSEYISPLSFDYYRQIFNLLLLLFPSILVILPLVVFHRIKVENPMNLHLLIASISMAAFILLWRAQLGVSDDWNLFANAIIPIALLIARSLIESEDIRGQSRIVFGWFSISVLHSYSWILTNHFFSN